jgi:hypothetical protein
LLQGILFQMLGGKEAHVTYEVWGFAGSKEMLVSLFASYIFQLEAEIKEVHITQQKLLGGCIWNHAVGTLSFFLECFTCL